MKVPITASTMMTWEPWRIFESYPPSTIAQTLAKATKTTTKNNGSKITGTGMDGIKARSSQEITTPLPPYVQHR